MAMVMFKELKIIERLIKDIAFVMSVEFLIGLIAGLLCTISFLPQVIKVIRTKNTEALSLATFSIFSMGVFLWLIYGILIGKIPIILANGITLILVIIILTLKIRYG
ncbi:MAG: SemiSWEET transporter [Thermodesulfovibrionales bacterium]|nr:SemiSWEET transporter [Thermodesulfovibrionales bacterium]